MQSASSVEHAARAAFWVRRPLFTAFLLGCAVSLFGARSLTPGRVAESTFTWCWAPLLQIASLAVVWKAARRPLPFRRAVDLFFAGNDCWWLFLVVFSAFWPLAPARIWLVLAAPVAAWSLRGDYQFFRARLESVSPVRDLLLQRAAAWIPGILIFGGGSLWPGLVEKLK